MIDVAKLITDYLTAVRSNSDKIYGRMADHEAAVYFLAERDWKEYAEDRELAELKEARARVIKKAKRWYECIENPGTACEVVGLYNAVEDLLKAEGLL